MVYIVYGIFNDVDEVKMNNIQANKPSACEKYICFTVALFLLLVEL